MLLSLAHATQIKNPPDRKGACAIVAGITTDIAAGPRMPQPPAARRQAPASLDRNTALTMALFDAIQPRDDSLHCDLPTLRKLIVQEGGSLGPDWAIPRDFLQPLALATAAALESAGLQAFHHDLAALNFQWLSDALGVDSRELQPRTWNWLLYTHLQVRGGGVVELCNAEQVAQYGTFDLEGEDSAEPRVAVCMSDQPLVDDGKGRKTVPAGSWAADVELEGLVPANLRDTGCLASRMEGHRRRLFALAQLP